MTGPVGASGDGGFSLVEIVIAMIIITYGVLGLAGTTLYTMREVQIADMATKRAVAVQSVVEQIQSQSWDSIAAGADTVGRYSVAWTTTTATNSKIVLLVSSGPGMVLTAQGPRRSSAAIDTLRVRVTQP